MNTPRLVRTDTGETFLVGKGEFTIGRAEDCSVILPAESVSERHASIRSFGDTHFFIRDLGSTNGTFVNGVRIAKAHLAEGNSIRIGETNFTFGLYSDEPPSQPDRNSPRESVGGRSGAPQLRYKGLWHPAGVTLIGIPLGFVFASVLIALNWHRLRRHGMATFAYFFAIAYALGVQWPLLPMFAWPWPYVVGMLVWFPVLGLPQWQYIRQHVPKPRPKRPWLRTIGIGIAIQVTIGIWDRYDQMAQASSLPAAPTAQPGEAEREYTTEELTGIAQNYVFEVRTTWKVRRYFIFQNEAGCAGSAVLYKATLGQLYFVTNRHVVEPPDGAFDFNCKVGTSGMQDALTVEVAAYGKNGVDLALLRIKSSDVKRAFDIPMTRAKDVVPGQSCLALGNALDSGISATAGIVSRLDQDEKNVLIRTSAPISHGNSGGGLFRLKGGTLIGITTAAREDGQNINFAIPVDYFAGDQSWDYLPGVSK